MDDYEYGIPDPDYGDLESSEPARVISRKRDNTRDEETSRNFNRYMINLFNQK